MLPTLRKQHAVLVRQAARCCEMARVKTRLEQADGVARVSFRTAELTAAHSGHHPCARGVGCVHRHTWACGSQTSVPWSW